MPPVPKVRRTRESVPTLVATLVATPVEKAIFRQSWRRELRPRYGIAALRTGPRLPVEHCEVRALGPWGDLAWFWLMPSCAVEPSGWVEAIGSAENLAATHRSLWLGSRPRPATGLFFISQAPGALGRAPANRGLQQLLGPSQIHLPLDAGSVGFHRAHTNAERGCHCGGADAAAD